MWTPLIALTAASAFGTVQTPVVVELFTSQSCSSCPPAEAYLRELADREDIIALEWHVDYWDTLRHGASGHWKDRYSNAAYTKRQRTYNLSLRGRSSAYTPQMVINGVYETVGSDREDVQRHIKKSADDVKTVAAARSADAIIFTLPHYDKNAHGLFITFKEKAETEIGGGENHGLRLSEVNIVTSLERISLSERHPGAQLKFNAPDEGYGCALLVQNGDGGAISNAAYCP